MNTVIRKGDFAVIGAVLLFAALIYTAFLTYGRDEPSQAVIHCSNGECTSFSLPYEGTYGPVGEYNIIVKIEGRRARISHSDCKDQICVNTGWLEHPGDTAICLPAGFSLSLEGKSDVDAVSGR